MERNDREMIIKMMEIDNRLKRLYESHKQYEEELSKYGRRSYLTEEEQQREKELKFMKLRGVDQMLHIASTCQEEAEPYAMQG